MEPGVGDRLCAQKEQTGGQQAPYEAVKKTAEYGPACSRGGGAGQLPAGHSGLRRRGGRSSAVRREKRRRLRDVLQGRLRQHGPGALHQLHQQPLPGGGQCLWCPAVLRRRTVPGGAVLLCAVLPQILRSYPGDGGAPQRPAGLRGRGGAGSGSAGPAGRGWRLAGRPGAMQALRRHLLPPCGLRL